MLYYYPERVTKCCIPLVSWGLTRRIRITYFINSGLFKSIQPKIPEAKQPAETLQNKKTKSTQLKSFSFKTKDFLIFFHPT